MTGMFGSQVAGLAGLSLSSSQNAALAGSLAGLGTQGLEAAALAAANQAGVQAGQFGSLTGQVDQSIAGPPGVTFQLNPGGNEPQDFTQIAPEGTTTAEFAPQTSGPGIDFATTPFGQGQQIAADQPIPGGFVPSSSEPSAPVFDTASFAPVTESTPIGQGTPIGGDFASMPASVEGGATLAGLFGGFAAESPGQQYASIQPTSIPDAMSPIPYGTPAGAPGGVGAQTYAAASNENISPIGSAPESEAPPVEPPAAPAPAAETPTVILPPVDVPSKEPDVTMAAERAGPVGGVDPLSGAPLPAPADPTAEQPVIHGSQLPDATLTEPGGGGRTYTSQALPELPGTLSPNLAGGLYGSDIVGGIADLPLGEGPETPVIHGDQLPDTTSMPRGTLENLLENLPPGEKQPTPPPQQQPSVFPAEPINFQPLQQQQKIEQTAKDLGLPATPAVGNALQRADDATGGVFSIEQLLQAVVGQDGLNAWLDAVVKSAPLSDNVDDRRAEQQTLQMLIDQVINNQNNMREITRQNEAADLAWEKYWQTGEFRAPTTDPIAQQLGFNQVPPTVPATTVTPELSIFGPIRAGDANVLTPQERIEQGFSALSPSPAQITDQEFNTLLAKDDRATPTSQLAVEPPISSFIARFGDLTPQEIIDQVYGGPALTSPAYSPQELADRRTDTFAERYSPAAFGEFRTPTSQTQVEPPRAGPEISGLPNWLPGALAPPPPSGTPWPQVELRPSSDTFADRFGRLPPATQDPLREYYDEIARAAPVGQVTQGYPVGAVERGPSLPDIPAPVEPDRLLAGGNFPMAGAGIGGVTLEDIQNRIGGGGAPSAFGIQEAPALPQGGADVRAGVYEPPAPPVDQTALETARIATDYAPPPGGFQRGPVGPSVFGIAGTPPPPQGGADIRAGVYGTWPGTPDPMTPTGAYVTQNVPQYPTMEGPVAPTGNQYVEQNYPTPAEQMTQYVLRPSEPNVSPNAPQLPAQSFEGPVLPPYFTPTPQAPPTGNEYVRQNFPTAAEEMQQRGLGRPSEPNVSPNAPVLPAWGIERPILPPYFTPTPQAPQAPAQAAPAPVTFAPPPAAPNVTEPQMRLPWEGQPIYTGAQQQQQPSPAAVQQAAISTPVATIGGVSISVAQLGQALISVGSGGGGGPPDVINAILRQLLAKRDAGDPVATAQIDIINTMLTNQGG